MSARVAFLERPVSADEQKPKTVLNAHAIIEHTGNAFVFLIKDNHAHKTPFVTGSSMDHMVEVLQGVEPGDTVVINPPKRLKNGSRITIQEK
jgi:HlyD family secretion protein